MVNTDSQTWHTKMWLCLVSKYYHKTIQNISSVVILIDHSTARNQPSNSLVVYTFLYKIGVYQHHPWHLNESVKHMQHNIFSIADFVPNVLLAAFWGHDHLCRVGAILHSSLSKQAYLLGLCKGSWQQCAETDGYQLSTNMQGWRWLVKLIKIILQGEN